MRVPTGYPEGSEKKRYTSGELLARAVQRLDDLPQYDHDRPAWGNELEQLKQLRDYNMRPHAPGLGLMDGEL